MILGKGSIGSNASAHEVKAIHFGNSYISLVSVFKMNKSVAFVLLCHVVLDNLGAYYRFVFALEEF